MQNAQSAEMVFTSNRAEPAEPLNGTPRLRAQPDGAFEKIMDRIEQLEFALAEAVLRTDEQTPVTSAPLEALASRLDAISKQLAGSTSSESDGDLSRIVDRLDAAAAARADEMAAISARITALEETRFAPIESALQALATNQQTAIAEVLARLEGAADTQLRAQVDRMADGLATLEAKLAARLSKIGETVETFANRPTPPPDITPLREMTARHMVAQKTIADRHASQIAKLIERFSSVEAEVQALPDQTALDALRAAIDAGQTPIVSRFDELTEMVNTVSADVKRWQDTNLSDLTEPLMARMDRLDTSAEQRQRDVNRELAELAARPQPVNDLTPVRESFARLMVALQAMHQSREAFDAETAKKIDVMMDGLQALPDRFEATSEHRHRDLVREITTLAERPLPAPDLTPVRETMSRFMVSVQALEDARANSEAELAARFGLLSERIEGMQTGSDPDALSKLLEPMAEAIQAISDRPAPALDTSAVRSAFSQQMVAISTWMQRQDVLQLAMSDLLETLVERNSAKGQDADVVETVKTIVAAGQFSARKQAEEAEQRLSTQLKELNRNFAGAGPDAPSDDQRLMEALQDLRRMVAEDGDPDGIADQARELRTALAETLAAMQAGQTARI